MDENELCPECGSDRWDGEECPDCHSGMETLECPFCGKFVAALGIDVISEPCACVVGIGSDTIYWNDSPKGIEFERLEQDAEAGDQDFWDLLEANPDFSKQYISAAGNSGGTTIWYAFYRQAPLLRAP